MIFESVVKLSIDSKIVHVAPLAKAVRGACSYITDDEQLLYNLELCLMEAVTNVINHSYLRKPNYKVDVEVTLNENQIEFKIIDSGMKNSNHVPNKQHYDATDIASLPESGMGLFLIHSIMDEITNLEEQGKNVMIMRKNITQPSKKL